MSSKNILDNNKSNNFYSIIYLQSHILAQQILTYKWFSSWSDDYKSLLKKSIEQSMIIIDNLGKTQELLIKDYQKEKGKLPDEITMYLTPERFADVCESMPILMKEAREIIK